LLEQDFIWRSEDGASVFALEYFSGEGAICEGIPFRKTVHC
jgi:hypothetical protein